MLNKATLFLFKKKTILKKEEFLCHDAVKDKK